MTQTFNQDISMVLHRIAEAWNIAPPLAQFPISMHRRVNLVSRKLRPVPVPRVNRVDMDLLRGIERLRDLLLENTLRFADGLPANNALLWGARGMGKSSLVKAAHAEVNKLGTAPA